MSKKLNCICIDDELPALKLLETYCKKSPQLNLMNSFSDPLQALQFVQKNPVDLVIMDIQMPGLNGINFFNQVKHKTTGIFISANPQFAINAYEMDIIDFILKPAAFERFEKAVQKVMDFTGVAEKEEDYLIIKQNYLSHKINISAIRWVEGSGEYIKLVTAEKTYMVFQRLKDFEKQYQDNEFIRIHKSYLVPEHNILSAGASVVKLKSGGELPVGRTYKNNIG